MHKTEDMENANNPLGTPMTTKAYTACLIICLQTNHSTCWEVYFLLN